MLLTLAFGVAAIGAPPHWTTAFLVAVVIFGALSLLGLRDLVQTPHAVLRNYPISAHLRFLLEEMRPEMRQYFFESETDGTAVFSATSAPSSISAPRCSSTSGRSARSSTSTPKATNGCAIRSRRPSRRGARSAVLIGGPGCAQPYSASVFNISAMSFGALSANAIRALNRGAALGGFAHDTGEGGFSPYHREGGGDIIWEIGSGYFGCRTAGRRVRSRRLRRARPRTTRSR